MAYEERGGLLLPRSAAEEAERRALRQVVEAVAGPSGSGVAEVDGKRFAVLSEDSDLFKSVSALKAQRQPYHLSPVFAANGIYQGVKEPKGLTLQTHHVLRQVPNRNPVIAAVLRKFQNEAAGYARRWQGKGDTGIRVGLRDRDAKPTKAEKKRMTEIEDVILQGGYRRPHPHTGEPGCWNAEGSEKALPFQTWVRAFLWDSLVLDAAALHFEVGWAERRYPVAWMKPVDAGLIRRVVTPQEGTHAVDPWMAVQHYRPDVRRELDQVAYVLLDPTGTKPLREFRWNELGYMVRNPRTDLWVDGYGYSELEQLVDVIAGILYGIDFNRSYFDKQETPRGLLTLAGNYSPEAIDAFRQELRVMGGPGNQWRMPVLSAKDARGGEFIKLREEPGNGMYWKEWILFCTVCACALYGLDPADLGFASFGQSQNALSQNNPEARMTSARVRGLESLLRALEYFLNEAVVWKYDEDFALYIEGVSQEDDQQAQAELQSRMQFGMTTPNMERARNDEEPIYSPKDPGLYRRIERDVRRELLARDMEDLTEEEIRSIIRDGYELQGGEWCNWPDAPVGNPDAMQVWMQETGTAPQDMGGPGGFPGDPGMGDPNDPNMPEDPAQGHEYAFGSDRPAPQGQPAFPEAQPPAGYQSQVPVAQRPPQGGWGMQKSLTAEALAAAMRQAEAFQARRAQGARRAHNQEQQRPRAEQPRPGTAWDYTIGRR